jgi:hypothetical protein
MSSGARLNPDPLVWIETALDRGFCKRMTVFATGIAIAAWPA